ncbi:MAG: T9SS type A sorting domain-containing protein [Candidatus Cloacimonetes bacterium]|nr:T9SS type A sorting domain-containing protein [Candidatus Cloacimonadota bacterium]
MKNLAYTLIFSFASIFLIFAEPIVVSGTDDNDYESWLIRLNDGRIMLTFGRNPDFNSGDIYVTFSENDGDNWTDPEPIVTGNADQTLTSFIQLEDNSIKMYYSSNESGNYSIVQTTSLNGIDWDSEEEVNLGWDSNYMVYDPNVFLCDNGSIIMAYVVYGQGVFVSRTNENGVWDTTQRLIDTSSYRPRIIQKNDGGFAIAYHKRWGDGQYDYEVFVKESEDLNVWSDRAQISNNGNSHDAFIYQSASGKFYVYYAAHLGGCYKLRRRTSDDLIFWNPEEIITDTTSNDTQPHCFIEEGTIYLSWAHATNYPDNHDVYFERFDEETDADDNLIEKSDFNLKCYPNPIFSYSNQQRSTISISFDLVKSEKVSIDLFNVKGQKISNIYNGLKNKGNNKIPWNGLDNIGKKVGSGCYFIRVKSSSTVKMGKVIVID